MRKVFKTIDECIHTFAQRSQDEGRCGNVYFENDTLYSYGRHFELAKFLTDKVVLINDTIYSKSTSKHQNIARHALSHYVVLYDTSFNIDKVLRELIYLKSKLDNAKKPVKYIDEALNLIERHRYSQGVYKQSNYGYESKLIEFNELERFFNSINDADKIKIYRHAQKQKDIEAFGKFQKEFYAYEPFVEYRNKLKNYADLIRRSRCGNFIESSQNVKVSITEVRELYAKLLNNEPIHGLTLDNYSITSFDGKTIKIGCHNININDVKKIMES